MKYFILGVLLTVGYYHQKDLKRFFLEVGARAETYHKQDLTLRN